MKTQFDSNLRVIALSNLEAMCKRISGMSHRFAVTLIAANTVTVEYSNPDEYGNPEPIKAIFPAWKDFDGKAVCLSPLKYVGCKGNNEEAWQAFWQLYDCPQLFRHTSDSQDWQTEYEILVAKFPEFAVTSQWDKNGCVQTWFCKGVEFPAGYREAQDYAVQEIKKLQKP